MSATTTRARVEAFIAEACERRANSLHFECYEDGAAVRIRVDGVLQRVATLTPEEHLTLVDEIKGWAGLEPGRDRPQDGRMRYGDLDIRLNVMPCCFGECVAMGLLSRRATILDLDRIDFSVPARRQLHEWLARRWGLVLVTGPTGSGKTTTLYAVLGHCSSAAVKVCTIEDPVEYAIPGACQAQVRPRVGVTFAVALRSILRQDPDVILVGEIRDLETAAVAVQAALSGHLVLSTLHARTASTALRRLLDMGVEPFLVRDALVGIVGQRLVRTPCTHCREAREADAALAAELALPPGPYWQARAGGCPECHGTGYRARVAVHELLEVKGSVCELVLARAAEPEIRQAAIAEGMVTMWQDALAKARDGRTSLDEAIRVARDAG